MWFVPRFTMLPGTPFGMVCLFCGSLRHRARDPANVAFFNLRSRLLVYSNRLRLLYYAALAARPPSNGLNVPVMPTITRPSISIPSVSHLLSPSLNHSSPRILRATFPEKPTFPIIKEKKKRKAILQSINSLTFPSGMHFFSYYRQLLQHQQLLRNHISQNLLRAGMRSQRRSGECTCLAS